MRFGTSTMRWTCPRFLRMRKLDWMTLAIPCSCGIERPLIEGSKEEEKRLLSGKHRKGRARRTLPSRRPCRGVSRLSLVRGHLLELDLRAGLFELLLELFGFRLRDAFLEGFRGGFYEVFGFLEAEGGDLADDLMTWILFSPESLRTTVNSVFSSPAAGRLRRGGRASGHGDGRGLDAELRLEGLDQARQTQ